MKSTNIENTTNNNNNNNKVRNKDLKNGSISYIIQETPVETILLKPMQA